MTKQKRIEEAIKIGIESGTADGAHHKMWTIDQMIRVLTGCPTVMEKFKNSEGTTHTYETLGESDEYLALIDEDWDVGSP